MAHVQKNTRAATGHLFDHYGRNAEDEKYKYLYRQNDSIDPEKTHLNYNLAPSEGKTQQEIFDERMSQVKCLKRKDVNVMCSWVVTVPRDLDPGRTQEFMQHTYNFLENRYGRKNVISAYVHMDETNPHMHFAFIPVVFDEKKQTEKVCAKEIINRHELQVFHEELQDYLENNMNCKVNILNEATKEGNKSIEELKRQSATKQLHEIAAEASRIVAKAQKQAQAINNSLIPIKAEYEAKKAYIEAIGKNFDLISDVEEQKGLFGKPTGRVIVPKEKWETQAVTRIDRDAQLKADKIFAQNVDEFKKTGNAKTLTALFDRVKELEHQNALLITEKRGLMQQLDKAEKEIDYTIDKVNKTLGKLPDSVADKFMQEWQRQNRTHRDMSR